MVKGTADGITFAGAYIGATDSATISLGYFLSGHAANTKVAYNNGTDTVDALLASGAPGKGTLTADIDSTELTAVAPVLDVVVTTNTPSCVYAYDLVLGTENHGTVRYVQFFGNGLMELDEKEFTCEATGIVKGNVNGDNSLDVCDLIKFKASEEFADVRTFDADNSHAYSDENFKYVRNNVWAFYNVD